LRSASCPLSRPAASVSGSPLDGRERETCAYRLVMSRLAERPNTRPWTRCGHRNTADQRACYRDRLVSRCVADRRSVLALNKLLLRGPRIESESRDDLTVSHGRAQGRNTNGRLRCRGARGQWFAATAGRNSARGNNAYQDCETRRHHEITSSRLITGTAPTNSHFTLTLDAGAGPLARRVIAHSPTPP
jgi:hypothetical protein